MTRASDKQPAPETRQNRASDKAPGPAKKDPLAEGNQQGLVRVRHPRSGDHYTTTRVLARKAGATLVEGQPATDKYGNPLPRKRNTKES